MFPLVIVGFLSSNLSFSHFVILCKFPTQKGVNFDFSHFCNRRRKLPLGIFELFLKPFPLEKLIFFPFWHFLEKSPVVNFDFSCFS